MLKVTPPDRQVETNAGPEALVWTADPTASSARPAREHLFRVGVLYCGRDTTGRERLRSPLPIKLPR